MRTNVGVWGFDMFQCVLLSLLLLFHLYRMYRIKHNGDFKGFFSCKTVQLEHVSYLVIISSLMIPILTMSTRMFDIYFNCLNDNLCHIIENTNLILTLISHFGIHLFVAMRSLLSSTDIKHPSVWFKIGLLLVSTNILVIIFPFIFNVLDTAHIITGCIVESKSLLFIIWIMIQDFIIGIYSLCVFVIPLRKLILWEQQTTNTDQLNLSRLASNSIPDKISTNDNQHFTLILQSIVQKVIICSTIMIMSTMITMTIQAILGPKLSTFVPNPFVINSYCVVLQFADIKVNDIKSLFCQRILLIIQCGCCNNKQCLCRYCYETKDIKCKKTMHPIVPSQSNVSSVATTVSKLEIRDPNIQIKINSENRIHSLPTPSEMPRLTPASSMRTEPSVSQKKTAFV